MKRLRIGFCGMMLVGAVLLGVCPLFSQVDGAFIRYKDTLNLEPRIGVGALKITPFRVGFDALYRRGEKWGSASRTENVSNRRNDQNLREEAPYLWWDPAAGAAGRGGLHGGSKC